MERLLFDTAHLREVGEIRYYILTEEIPQSAYQTEQTGETCGVMVELDGERTEIADITPSRRRVRALLDRMCRGTVTPVAVRDVVDDWLLE